MKKAHEREEGCGEGGIDCGKQTNLEAQVRVEIRENLFGITKEEVTEELKVLTGGKRLHN